MKNVYFLAHVSPARPHHMKKIEGQFFLEGVGFFAPIASGTHYLKMRI